MGYDQLHEGMKKSHQVEEYLSYNNNTVNNNNILSRNSSVGCSSRIYYYRSSGAGGIPFNWEMQPGTPKDPPKEEAIPTLSPPPAVVSLGLPKPCISINEDHHQPYKSYHFMPRTLIRFLKKSKKNDKLQSSSKGKTYNYEPKKDINYQNNNYVNNNNVTSTDQEKWFEFCISDCEFMASPARNSSSSSSSSLSFSNGVSSSRFQSPAWNPPSKYSLVPSCSPWKFSSILVSLAKRFSH